MRTRDHPPAAPYLVLCGLWVAASAVMVRQALAVWSAASHPGAAGIALATVLALVTLAQVTGAFFLLGFLAKAAAYLVIPDPPVETDTGGLPPVAVLYLTAGDFDAEAVDSLLRLEHGGHGRFILHDDGNSEAARREMSAYIERHPCRGR